MTIQLYGKAVPYNVPNSFYETLLPGSLDQALAKKKSIPMLEEHKGNPVGRWTSWESKPDGLYVRGVLEDPDTIERFNTGQLHHLSITYGAKSQKIMTNHRLLDQIERQCVKKRLPFPPPEVVLRLAQTFGITRVMQLEFNGINSEIACVSEISLVEDPAFKGCWVKDLQLEAA